jgi:hypothetical protein
MSTFGVSSEYTVAPGHPRFESIAVFDTTDMLNIPTEPYIFFVTRRSAKFVWFSLINTNNPTARDTWKIRIERDRDGECVGHGGGALRIPLHSKDFSGAGVRRVGGGAAGVE